MREIPFSVLRGFFMGAADIVPGVSGGTIALVFGIYERLVASIKDGSSALGAALRLDLRTARGWLVAVEWRFILPLLGGIGIAVLLLAGVIEHQLDTNPIEMSALFAGLVAGSIVVAWQLLGHRDAPRMLILVAVAVAVFVVLGLFGGTTQEAVGQLESVALWAFFVSGAIAICAMILPGISGSFILVLVGMYGPVLAAVNDRDLPSLGVFAIGAITGLALFSQLLHWALEHHHDSVMAALIGLMAGSMRVLWPWPDGVESTALGAPDESVGPAVVLAVMAFGVVVVMHRLAVRRQRRHDALEHAAAAAPGDGPR